MASTTLDPQPPRTRGRLSRGQIASLVGMGPDADVIDVRAVRALNSVGYIRSHEHAPHASTYQLTTLGPGLYELTYALRASTPFPSAQLGDWIWDPVTDTMAFSPRVAEMYGVQGLPPMTRSQLN